MNNDNSRKRVYAQFFTGDDDSEVQPSKSTKIAAASSTSTEASIEAPEENEQESGPQREKCNSMQDEEDEDFLLLMLDDNDGGRDVVVVNSQQQRQQDDSGAPPSRSIVVKPIDQKSIHKICSGQVITCMSDAVKELIENSLDAGATVIEVLFKDDGLTQIQVSDNGTGIHRENYELVVKKHCTSKISCFEDIEQVTSFGFRGEALSSLCAISDVSIITRTSAEKLGTLLIFDHLNNLVEQKWESVARDVGTTVSIQNIFKNYPVRLIQLKKNAKREYTKCLSVIEQYCLISDGLRLSCYTHESNNSRNKKLVLQTRGTCLRDNIAGVLGGNMFKKLQEIDCKSDLVHIKGYISKVDVGCGRSSSDRQFLYLNSRPVDITKISKMVNVIYKQFNLTQYPIYVLNIVVRPDSYDVNVTPDKRKVYLENEQDIVAFIKETLEKLYDAGYRSFVKNNHMNLIDYSPLVTEKEEVERIFSLRQKELASSSQGSDRSQSQSKNSQSWSDEMDDILYGGALEDSTDTVQNSTLSDSQPSYSHRTLPKISQTKLTKNTKVANTSLADFFPRSAKDVQPHQCCSGHNEIEDNVVQSTLSAESQLSLSSADTDEPETVEIIFDDQIEKRTNNQEPIVVQVDTSSVIGAYSKCKTSRAAHSSADSTKRFLNLGIRPNNNKDCEAELSKQLSKQDFLKMEIIGQFNKGFIISKLGNDLFIVDQHASDEKYNFEDLKANTRMNTQPLIVPKSLELSATDELVVMDHIEIFEKNGFRFQIDNDAPVSERVKLLAVPHSKSAVFNENDVHEMIFLLHEYNPELIAIRPSKISAIFASRACRKSIMIGKTLSHSDMKRVVTNMSTMEQPWNCPHGRPTIRHMIDLRQIKRSRILQQQHKVKPS